MDVSSWLRKQLEETSPDLLRAMVKESGAVHAATANGTLVE